MTRQLLSILTLLTAALLMLPIVAASAAHPSGNTYYGTSLTNARVYADDTYGGVHVKTTFRASATITGVCVDVLPVATISPLPPQPYRDGIAEQGVGGGCFAFETIHGDDTGSMLTVRVTDSYVTGATWVACVDLNGDGLCVDSVDDVNVCWTGGSNTGSQSLSNPGSSCDMYADPAATLNPALYVWLIGRYDAANGAIDTTVAVRGTISI